MLSSRCRERRSGWSCLEVGPSRRGAGSGYRPRVQHGPGSIVYVGVWNETDINSSITMHGDVSHISVLPRPFYISRLLLDGEYLPLHSFTTSRGCFCCPSLQPCASKLSKTLEVLKWSCSFSTRVVVVRGAHRLLCVRVACSPSHMATALKYPL